MRSINIYFDKGLPYSIINVRKQETTSTKTLKFKLMWFTQN